jgi:hypothetical protein
LATITLHQFAIYDINTDESLTSRRWGTAEAIAAVRGIMIPGTATVVDSSINLEDGLTQRGFDPGSFLVSNPAKFP